MKYASRPEKKLTIINETEATLPSVAFADIKNAALGKDYILNVIVAKPETMRSLNLIYRGKRSATDILSFPISESEGDIYICPEEARKEAPKFDRPYDNFISFLFIHGCVHLKGMDHGATMEHEEEKLRAKFAI